MLDVFGRPGTRGSLVLRVSQLVSAAAAMFTMAAAYGSESYSAFSYLGFSMFGQLFWSFILACTDIVCLVCKMEFNRYVLVSAVLGGDWFVGILSFSAATASAGVTVLFRRDTEFCRDFPQFTCGQYGLAVILAFVAWSFIAASALSSFWFWVSLLV